jgi:hypothetical protein
MKKVILFILLLSFQIAQSQVTDFTMHKSAQELFDYHTIKQKKNKTTAWILLGSGVAMTIGGFAILENNATTILTDIYSGKSSGDGTVSTLLIITGGASTLASIPFFISAGKHKRKATLSLKGEQNIMGNLKIDNSNYLALNITIPF